jgi:hypothetical protein
MVEVEKFPRIHAEDDQTLTIWGLDKRRRTYYKARSRLLPLVIDDLRLLYQSALPRKRNREEVLLPPLRPVLHGTATLESGVSVAHMTSPNSRTSQFAASLYAPLPTEIEAMHEWARVNGRIVNSENYASIHFRSADAYGPEAWALECWLPASMMESLASHVISATRPCVQVGVTGDDILVDNGFEPDVSEIEWIVKPLSLDATAVQTTGHLGYITLHSLR